MTEITDQAQVIRNALNDGAKPGMGHIIYHEAWAALDSLLNELEEMKNARDEYLAKAMRAIVDLKYDGKSQSKRYTDKLVRETLEVWERA